MLTAGFTVQRFHDWFRDESDKALRNVPDTDIIAFCARNGWLLLTADHEMRNRYREQIKRTDVAILATAHNTVSNPDEWVAAIINLKSRILREFRNHERPWFATFSRAAKLNFCSLR